MARRRSSSEEQLRTSATPVVRAVHEKGTHVAWQLQGSGAKYGRGSMGQWDSYVSSGWDNGIVMYIVDNPTITSQ